MVSISHQPSAISPSIGEKTSLELPMRTLRFLVSALAACAPLAAADLPLGIVTQVADEVTVTFDASVHLAPGSMLALYGPGAVEKHPLTGEVLIERRALIAKAQITGIDGGTYRARLTWSAAKPQTGADAVPLPGEAAPNGAPAQTAAATPLVAPAGDTVTVTLPVVDPDGDALGLSWRLDGPAGCSGVLAARTTTVAARAASTQPVLPTLEWTAPAMPAEATIVCTVRDAWGQTLTVTQPVKTTTERDWRTRQPVAIFRSGTDDAALARIVRAPDGTWWAIDTRGSLHRFAAGWRPEQSQTIANTPKNPVALVPVGDELFVLDGRGVTVYGADGEARRTLGTVQKPTDLAVGADGTLFIADLAAGGVVVFEADGRCRGRLGRAGDGSDDFVSLTRLALDRDGALFALDGKSRSIHRFDRQQHHLPSWPIPCEANETPVDLAVQPQGLLMVLLSSGRILRFDAKGNAATPWKSLAETNLAAPGAPAAALTVDALGEAVVTFPEAGLTARYAADGACTGVRGGVLWKNVTLVAADGRGRLFAYEDDAGTIIEFDSDGWLTARFGGKLKQGGLFDEPVALAVTPDGEALTVLDVGRYTVVRIALDGDRGKPVTFGQEGRQLGQFKKPVALAMDAAGRTYVLDAKLKRVQAFDASGACLFAFGRYDSGKDADELSEPTRLAVAPGGDLVYVFDEDTYMVKKFAIDTAKGAANHVGNTGGKGTGPGQFKDVIGLAVDRHGLVYAWDDSRGDLQVFDFHGVNAVSAPPRSRQDLGAERVGTMALAPDGQLVLVGKGVAHGWRWK
jgi:DNA-binding beta-propeller fold protein YncE